MSGLDDQNIIEKSLVLISDPNQRSSFGTGFAIGATNDYVYILTCAHVVENMNPIEVNGFQAETEAIGSGDAIDLAVLRVPMDDSGNNDRKFRPESLVFCYSASEGDTVGIKGYYKFDNHRTLGELQAVIDKKRVFADPTGRVRIDAWDLRIANDLKLEPGYSGSPVFDLESKEVIGVVSYKMAPAAGVAILINEIRKIWRNPVLQEQKILANQSNTQGIYDRLYPWISRKANLELELKIQYNEEPNSRNSDEIQRIKDELSFIRRIERLERGIASLNGVERVREIGNFVDDMLYKIQSIRKSDLHDPSLITSMYGIVNRYLQEAITITQSAFLYTRFAQSLFEQNDNDELEAFRYSEKAIQLGPEYPKAYHQHIIICRALEIRPELRAKMRQIIIDCIHKLLKLKEPVEQELINDYL